MLRLTKKKADYGLMALKFLATPGRGSLSAKDIAEAYHIPHNCWPKSATAGQSWPAAFARRHEWRLLLIKGRAGDSAFEVIYAIDGPLLLRRAIRVTVLAT